MTVVAILTPLNRNYSFLTILQQFNSLNLVSELFCDSLDSACSHTLMAVNRLSGKIVTIHLKIPPLVTRGILTV